MSAQNMLEQLLQSGLSAINPGAQSSSGAQTQADSGWGKFGAGAVTGGALGLLLGSKRGRKIGGKALKYGSVAALGVVALKAYSSWKAQQGQTAQTPSPHTQSTNPPQPTWTPAQLSAPPPDTHSQALLSAMIAAAKSDGHIDERERALIDQELQRLQAQPEDRQWMQAQLSRPLDPAEIARAADSPEQAAEMYLASVLMVDETNFMERAYLDELAKQLQLAPDLKAHLEAQASA